VYSGQIPMTLRATPSSGLQLAITLPQPPGQRDPRRRLSSHRRPQQPGRPGVRCLGGTVDVAGDVQPPGQLRR
jgi:hypothetical protein